ncbi:HAMP domain-containing sensor histidine kinase [Bacillus sp. 1NLA3E]|uniref:HAMP domain-containing sensor histidine kinase n=1 Tax=Bacillus sp. 1NLA3E TaxID=666686 RepID=UPI000247ED69|nr:HAMP domain-containing sensor histidine kinase [Bacillus sp. 1NLA3E]AGK55650.1 two-component sensor histidine kinase [Bacillus sp. 1NLA3E]
MNLRVSGISLKLGLLFSSVFLTLIFILELVLYGVFMHIFVDYVTQDLLERGSNHAKILSENYNQNTIDHVITMEKGGRTSVLITDSNNQIIASSVHPDKDMKSHLLKQGNMKVNKLLEKDWKHHDYLISVTTIGHNKGHLYMYYPTNIVREIVLVLKILILLTFIGMILLSFGLIGILSQKITRPLLIMKDATQKMAKGEYKQKITTKGNDEVAQLGQSIQGLGEKLQAFEDSRNDFLADVSHELRTPLTYIKGYSDILSKGMYKNSIEQAEYTAIINKEANRLSFLLNDLFEMSKLQVGKFELSMEMANINTIIEKVIMNLTPAAVEKGIVLKRNLANDIPELNIDIQRMEQVLYNLIENALKYTDKGEITVKAYQEKETKIIEISDTGIGIPKLDIPYIWERFYRVDKSRTRNTGGSGLGLFVVKQIVEAHGGKIEVNSIVGMGSTFRIYFHT